MSRRRRFQRRDPASTQPRSSQSPPPSMSSPPPQSRSQRMKQLRLLHRKKFCTRQKQPTPTTPTHLPTAPPSPKTSPCHSGAESPARTPAACFSLQPTTTTWTQSTLSPTSALAIDTPPHTPKSASQHPASWPPPTRNPSSRPLLIFGRHQPHYTPPVLNHLHSPFHMNDSLSPIYLSPRPIHTHPPFILTPTLPLEFTYTSSQLNELNHKHKTNYHHLNATYIYDQYSMLPPQQLFLN